MIKEKYPEVMNTWKSHMWTGGWMIIWKLIIAVIIAVIDATFEPYICLKIFQASFLQVQKLRCITVIYFHTKISRKQTWIEKIVKV